MSVRIVILDKGFVSVGVYSQGTDWCSLDNAYIVRRWGTTAGLGELAEKGPLSSTILDKTPKQNFPARSIVNTIECNEKNWAKTLEIKAKD